ncbi:hypothetical protein [Streptomyces sioyaensis]|uniref:hypothetical protein n=1 Tax=Streptomyces sioyaensis TaxID=67364 RepID=UPI0037142598
MSRKRKLVVALTATAFGLSIVGTNSAQAATYSSVEVYVSTYYSDEVVLCGRNQNDTYVCSPTFATPGSGYTKLSGWWWKKGSQIEITGHNKSNNTYPKVKFRIGPPHNGSEHPCTVYNYYADCDGRSRKVL